MAWLILLPAGKIMIKFTERNSHCFSQMTIDSSASRDLEGGEGGLLESDTPCPPDHFWSNTWLINELLRRYPVSRICRSGEILFLITCLFRCSPTSGWEKFIMESHSAFGGFSLNSVWKKGRREWWLRIHWKGWFCGWDSYGWARFPSDDSGVTFLLGAHLFTGDY